MIFEDDLCLNEDGLHWLNDTKFKRKYSCLREMLDKTTAIIEKNEVLLKALVVPNEFLLNIS